MGFTYRIDLKWIDESEEEIREAASDAVVEYAVEGKNAMQLQILEATTPTGQARAEGGGYAGRYETGRFFNAVDEDVDENRDEYTGTIGLLHDFAVYMRYQDEGTARIEAAGSLESGHQEGVVALERVLASRGLRKGAS